MIAWPVPTAASVATSRIRCQTSVPSGAKRRTKRCPNPPKLSVTPVTYTEPSLATATPSPVSCPPVFPAPLPDQGSLGRELQQQDVVPDADRLAGRVDRAVWRDGDAVRPVNGELRGPVEGPLPAE